MKWLLALFLGGSALAQDLGSFSNLPFLSAGAGSGFPTPPNGIHNLVAWYSASNNVTSHLAVSPPPDGGDVNTWGDLSGHNYTLVGTNVNHIQPFYKVSGGSNSGPYIYTDVATAYSLHTATPVTSQPNTYYFVASIDVASANGCMLNANSDQNIQINMSATPTAMNIVSGGANVSIPSSTYFNAFTLYPHWAVWTFQINGSSTLVRTNGVLCVGSLNPGSSSDTGLTVFNYFNNSQSTHVLMQEMLWDNFAPTSTDMLHVEEYLATKWGIGGIP